MSRPVYTDSELHNMHIRYFSQLVLYQVMIVIQITLIVATAIKFYRKTKTSKLTDEEAKINKRINILFTTVLATGTLIFLLVEWYGVADFLYDFAAWTNYCDVAAILGNLSILTYLLFLYLFYLYRLYATFRDSAIELSPFMIKALVTVTFGVYFAMVVLTFMFQKGAVKHTPFAWSMKEEDYKWIIICEGEFSIGIDPMLRWALQALVVVGNMYYGWIFYKKLYDLLQFIQAQTQKNIAVDTQSQGIMKLMNKQTTLVMVSTVSTSIMWTLTNVLHYFGSYWQILVYLDISVNCLCLFLMFAWNDKLYRKLCKPCIICNKVCCSSWIKGGTLKAMEKEIEEHQSKTSSKKNGEIHIHDITTSKPNESKPDTSEGIELV